MQEMSNEINIKNLLVSGAHFGSKTSEWHPKSRPYIYGIRNGVYIIDLETTVEMWRVTREFVVSTVASGGEVLFVGTKHNVSEVIKQEAERCGALYVNQRWLGGTLTNFKVIAKSLEKLKSLEEFIKKAEESKEEIRITKLELSRMHKEVEKLKRCIGGLRKLKFTFDAKGEVKVVLPKIIFITDTHKEELAVREARRLRIPIVALTDTTTNPEIVDYPIPTNDDSTKGLSLFTRAMADAVEEGNRLKALQELTALGQEMQPEAYANPTEPFLAEVPVKQIEEEKARKDSRNKLRNKELIVETKLRKN
jgi:small subunit ribosomal protein S2